jgi:hypothetical protein
MLLCKPARAGSLMRRGSAHLNLWFKVEGLSRHMRSVSSSFHCEFHAHE